MNRLKFEVKAKLPAAGYASTPRSIAVASQNAITARGRSSGFFTAVHIQAIQLSTDDKMVLATRQSRLERLKYLGRAFRQVAATLKAVRNNTLKHPYMLSSLVKTALQVGLPVSMNAPEKILRDLLKYYLGQFRFIAKHYATGSIKLPA